MGIEIERKFLLRSDDWRSLVSSSQELTQGYLTQDDKVATRVRLQGSIGVITIKGRGVGASRPEFEYEIPTADARQLLAMCGERVISKVRHIVPINGVIWEIDVFTGRHKGLILAEVELNTEDQNLTLPEWIGEEVTTNPQYLNQVLAGQ